MAKPSPEWTGGVCLVCLGCLCAATGLTLMKSSTVHEGEKPFCLRWRWLIGFSFLGILTTVIDVYVLGILPLSVVAPFAGLTIVFALCIARTGLLADVETVSRSDMAGSGLIILGVTLVSVFGPHESHGVTEDMIMADFQKPFFAVFAGASLLTVAVWVLLLLLPPLRACCLHDASLLATALSAYSAAVCGALCQLFVKVVAVTLHTTGGDFTGPDSPWRSLPPYFAFVGLAVCAPLQLYLLDTALTGSAVSYAVPVYQALLIFLTTAAGGVFFGEFELMTPQQALAFCAGVGTASAGLAVLSRTSADADEQVAPRGAAPPASPVFTPMRPGGGARPGGGTPPPRLGSRERRPSKTSLNIHQGTVVVSSAALGVQILQAKQELEELHTERRERAVSEGYQSFGEEEAHSAWKPRSAGARAGRSQTMV